MSSKAFLTGALVAGILATGALVATSKPEIVLGKALGDEVPVVPAGPIGDSLATGRGADLTGLVGGARIKGEQQKAAPPQEKPKPGTVKLPEGGTATLVRREVVNGVLPVPDGIGEATWWGAELTGKEGATVLAGHVDWKGAKGPFAELWRAAVGREITVADSAGKQFTFKVSQVLTINKNDLPNRALELFGPRGAHRLVLVTCGGQWIGGQSGYEANRVVIADPL
ncbi:sortase [Lentzea sp. NBRC 105346]|uniref:class F sortase n=1 Tax=Lentzea sp. NBRC 105346 TaxID=3032205 RepID=UPI0024A1DAFF|nr:class F sortase [Lentzea sp. NBRC 105346]GLZ35526.1 sortase [Lentzea sp. NBRC 105346]